MQSQRGTNIGLSIAMFEDKRADSWKFRGIRRIPLGIWKPLQRPASAFQGVLWDVLLPAMHQHLLDYQYITRFWGGWTSINHQILEEMSTNQPAVFQQLWSKVPEGLSGTHRNPRSFVRRSAPRKPCNRHSNLRGCFMDGMGYSMYPFKIDIE